MRHPAERKITTIVALVLGGAVLSLLAPSVGPVMMGLQSVIDPDKSYFAFSAPVIQFVLVPLSVVGAGTLVMAPGLLLAVGVTRGGSLWQWLLDGFAISLVVVSVTTAIVQWLIGSTLKGTAFIATIGTLAIAAGAWAMVRAKRTHDPGPGIPAGIALVLLVPLLFLLCFLPKFFWEAFNGDGAHAFEATRLLLSHPLPFWNPAAGAISHFPGMNSLVFTYPGSWFMRLFGEGEASVRLPLILYMPLLIAAIVVVAERGGRRPLSRTGLAFITLGVLGFELAMAFSATYDPYSADIALPATQDTLAMVFFLGAVAAYERREYGGLAGWTLLGLMNSPAGLLMPGAFLLGLFVSQGRAFPWREVFALGLGLFACLVVLAVIPPVLALVGTSPPGGEHGLMALARKFGNISLLDVKRVVFAVLPTGIYPVAAFLAWRQADRISRTLLVTTAIIFGMYYVIASISLHYFVPAMVLPLAVFWRRYDVPELGRPALGVCAMGVVAAVWFGLPQSWSIYTATRDVGERLAVVGIEGYRESGPDVFMATERLTVLFPTDAHPDVPDLRYGGSPIAWNYYSQRAGTVPDSASYLVARTDETAPPGRVVFQDSLVTISVRNSGQYQADRELKPRGSQGRAAYAVARDVLFLREEIMARPGFFSPGRWALGVLGIEIN